MRLKAYLVRYTDDRDPQPVPASTYIVVGGDTAPADLQANFQEDTTAHHHPIDFTEIPLTELPASEKSAAVDRFATQLDVAILDSEDESTVRTRLETQLDVEVTPAMVATGLAGILASRSLLPLVTETEEGEAGVGKACMKALVEAGLIEANHNKDNHTDDA